MLFSPCLLHFAAMNARDIISLGQVFTPQAVVFAMLALRRRAGSVLEPACGDGAFLQHLPAASAVEFDARFAPANAHVGDFFAWEAPGRFDTIIGNPPYVRNPDIPPATRERLPKADFERRGNLYLYFISRCLDLLAPGGELIFITPRNFLKATSAHKLNRKLYALGTITHAIDLGDKRSFAKAVPNCLIWRFERDDFSRRTAFLDAARFNRLDEVFAAAQAGAWEMRAFVESSGHLAFTSAACHVALGDVFSVKVGAVSGADAIFANETYGTHDFVCSHTATTGRTRRMIWSPEAPPAALEPFRERLLARRIVCFDKTNWWRWGRGWPQTDAPRIYVNGRTRRPQPFFLNPSNNFDGAILALFPYVANAKLAVLCDLLNHVDWAGQGFVCDGRFLFTQRALEQAWLPEAFAAFARAERAADAGQFPVRE